MTKEIYIVEFESANYAGAPEHCTVMASDEDEAMMLAEDWANDFYYQQDSEQLQDEGLDEEGPHASIVSAVPLIGSEFEQYYADEIQRNAFYPMVA